MEVDCRPGSRRGASDGPEGPVLRHHAVGVPLLSAWILLGMVAELVLADSGLHRGQAVRVLGIAVLYGLARSQSPTRHLIGLRPLAALQLAFIRVVTPGLS